MNLTHLKYIIEVEKQGSITKAAAALFMGQPNLSKIIKDTEREVGVPIFMRSPKGIVPTDKGKEFLSYAKTIIAQLEKIEKLHSTFDEKRISFSLLLPRASYITCAFTRFLNSVEKDSGLDIKFKETNSVDAINSIADCEYNMGVIRFPINYEGFFLPIIHEKGLRIQNEWEYNSVIITSKNSALLSEASITEDVLDKYTEILHGDNIVPNVSEFYRKNDQRIKSHSRHIYVYERGSQFDILSACEDSYMWVSPMPKEILERCGLVQLSVPNIKRPNKDLLVCHENYRLTDKDKMFADKLKEVRKELAGG